MPEILSTNFNYSSFRHEILSIKNWRSLSRANTISCDILFFSLITIFTIIPRQQNVAKSRHRTKLSNAVSKMDSQNILSVKTDFISNLKLKYQIYNLKLQKIVQNLGVTLDKDVNILQDINL